MAPLTGWWLVIHGRKKWENYHQPDNVERLTLVTLFWFRETYRTTFVAAPRIAAA
jgi:hypothetical protein